MFFVLLQMICVIVVVAYLITRTTSFTQVLDAGGRCLLINLCDLDYISSSGLRVLLAALKRLKKDGGTLRIACGNPQILEVFTMAGFHRIFSISPDEAAALAGFPAGS